MVQLVTRWAIRLVVVIAAVVVALAGFTMVKDKGLLSPFGINSEGQDTQVIQAVQRVQEVALLAVHIEDRREVDVEPIAREALAGGPPETRHPRDHLGEG